VHQSVEDVLDQVEERTPALAEKMAMAAVPALRPVLLEIGDSVADKLAPEITKALVSRGAETMAQLQNAQRSMAVVGANDVTAAAAASGVDLDKILSGLDPGMKSQIDGLIAQFSGGAAPGSGPVDPGAMMKKVVSGKIAEFIKPLLPKEMKPYAASVVDGFLSRRVTGGGSTSPSPASSSPVAYSPGVRHHG